jgi:hypothetical protein
MRRGWRFASPPAPANRKRYNLRRLCGGYCDLLQARFDASLPAALIPFDIESKPVDAIPAIAARRKPEMALRLEGGWVASTAQAFEVLLPHGWRRLSMHFMNRVDSD